MCVYIYIVCMYIYIHTHTLKCVCVCVYIYIYDEVRHNELNAHGIFVEKLNVKRSQTLIST